MTNVVIDPFDPSDFSFHTLVLTKIKCENKSIVYSHRLQNTVEMNLILHANPLLVLSCTRASIRTERGHVGVFRDILRICPSWCFSEPV